MPKSKETLLDIKVFNALQRLTHVKRVFWGGVGHYRGSKMLKVSNGMPGQLLVQICQPGRLQKVHVYADDCQVTTSAILAYGRQENIEVRLK